MRNLRGRDFLITGASSGLGRAMLLRAAPLGRRFLLVGRDPERLMAAATAARERGAPEVETLVLDLGLPGAGRRLAEGTAACLAQAPILLLNAGYSLQGPAWELDDEACRHELATNARSIHDFLHAFGDGLRAHPGSRILLSSSIAGFQGVPGQAGYAASKAYLLSLGQALGVEWRRHGVTVCSFAAGLMETDFFARAGIARDRRWARLGRFMPADEAAERALALLDRGALLGTAGLGNRLSLLFARFLSRRRIAALTDWSCRR
ncbi:MAG: SDR family NAD(P)-dependent oxidoreductase [Planctomycetes bacterium]|nr:SDR family NAD(P)-dependent oxidoreductase [Planctomycetota bacterium]